MDPLGQPFLQLVLEGLGSLLSARGWEMHDLQLRLQADSFPVRHLDLPVVHLVAAVGSYWAAGHLGGCSPGVGGQGWCSDGCYWPARSCLRRPAAICLACSSHEDALLR